MKWYKYDIRDLTDDEYNKWYSLMSTDKQSRVDRFRFADDKKRTIAGEMLARKAIAEWCGIAPESIVFGIKEHGKPYAKNSTVEFNISHSGDMVVCAIDDRPIGIDVEKIRPIDISVAKRICSNNELRYLFGSKLDEFNFCYTTDMKILTRFFEIWTAKEAYSKSIGGRLRFVDTQAIEYNSFFVENGYVVTIYT